MTRVYLSLGANLGEPVAQLAEALRRLGRQPGVRLVGVSSVYRTAPWGKTDQPDFYNAAAVVESELEPQALLAVTQQVERAMGRERKERWGPRLIDLDLLLFGEESVESDGLSIPHPRLWERAFVLKPLLDILAHGPLATKAEAHLNALPDQGIGLHLGGDSFLRLIQEVE